MSKIVIDCGHNSTGSDRGAKCYDGRMENDLNREVVKRLTALLTESGHTVIPIGNDGSDVMSRGAVGEKNGCDLMLSIHHNAYGQGANGTSVIKSVFADRDAPKAAQCAQLILNAIPDAIGTRARNGGKPDTRWNSTKKADYYGVIRGNGRHNTLIVESLFCDNAADLSRWDPDKIASAINGAVCAVFGRPANTAPGGSGSTGSTGGSGSTGGTGGKPVYAVGDTVSFSGGSHFVSSDAKSPVGGIRTAGRAKLTKIAAGAAHPYHLIGTTSNVYGWVDTATVSK